MTVITVWYLVLMGTLINNGMVAIPQKDGPTCAAAAQRLNDFRAADQRVLLAMCIEGVLTGAAAAPAAPAR